MCGISVLLHLNSDLPLPSQDESRKILNDSLELIKHRGPDSRGIWISPNSKVGLGHVRLSILDLSEEGSQPLHDTVDGTVHAVVNGEIYDYESLRATLESEGYRFRSRSDSELVVAMYLHFGLDFPNMLTGEFAIVLYDEVLNSVFCARDRYGIKPLYFTTSEDRVLIASEIKAFIPLGWKPEWDVQSLLDCGWNYDQRTLFAGVQKVPAANMMTFRLFDSSNTSRPYWKPNYPCKSIADPRELSEMVEGVRDRMIEAVSRRLVADVPVGVYLSGGIDSSVVAGIAKHLVSKEGKAIGCDKGSKSVTCFSIGFVDTADEAFDESPIAKRTAEFLGVDFRPLFVSQIDLVENLEEAVWHAEHPMPDLNFVAKFLLSDFATSQGFKVVLTGEGADEIFAGYSLFKSDFLSESDLTTPLAMTDEQRVLQMELLNIKGDKTVGGTFSGPTIDLKSRAKMSRPVGNLNYPHLQASGAIWDIDSFAPWTKEFGLSNPVLAMNHDLDGLTRTNMFLHWHPLHSALYLACKGPLPSLLLACLGDRSEMAHSLEARPPFLDHHLTDYVNMLPPSTKIWRASDGSLVEKYILREAAKPFVTDELFYRQKHPYTAPMKYQVDSAVHRKLSSLLTAENISKLGFISFPRVESLMRMAFGSLAASTAYRQCLIIAELVILGQRFAIPQAKPSRRIASL